MIFRIVFLLLLIMPGISVADEVMVTTPSEFPATMGVAEDFTKAVPGMIERTINSASYKKLYINLFLALGLIFTVMHVSKYMLGGLGNEEVISAFLVLGLIGSAPLWYQQFIGAFLSFSQGLGNIVQLGILGNSSPNYPVEFMFNVIGRFSVDLSWNPLSWLTHIIEIIILFLVSILMVLFAMASVIAALAQSYVYIPLAVTGLVIMPFALFPPMGFLFDGWLRMFLLVVFFGVFARVCVAVGVFGMSIMMGIHNINDFNGTVFEFSWDNIFRITGAASIALLGLLMVAGSYQLASGIVSGGGSVFGGAGAVSRLNGVLRKLQGH